MKLHEISQGLARLEELLEGDDDIQVYLDSVQMQLAEKSKNLFFFLKKYNDFEDSIDEEIKRLQELKKHYKNHHTRIKDYIAYSMNQGGVEKIESDLVKFSFRKSTSIDITDSKLIPKEYTIEKITYSPDKPAIKEAIKSGKQVPGAELKENKNLQIK